MTQEFRTPVGTDLEHLASQLDRALTTLADTEQRFADRQIVPGEVAFRDPAGSYHQITIGAVLTAWEFSAHDARALDGLLSMNIDEVIKLIQQMVDEDPDGELRAGEDETVGAALTAILTRHSSTLESRGRYVEWRRSFDRYQETTERFLSGLGEVDLAKMSLRPPSRKQLSLIRTTCANLRLEFPVLADRADAFRWLRDVGANTRYRELS